MLVGSDKNTLGACIQSDNMGRVVGDGTGAEVEGKLSDGHGASGP